MPKPQKPLNKKQKEKNKIPVKKGERAHRWKGMDESCPLMQEMEKRAKEFEDSTTTLRMKIARKYNVEYHSFYFTRVVPG